MAEETVNQITRGSATTGSGSSYGDDDGIAIVDIARLLVSRWKLLVLGPLTAGLLALGIAYLIPPIYTASTTFMPPQQTQGTAASALASLESLAGLAGGLTPAAYVFAANFQRESVGVSLQENLDKTRRDTGTELVRESTTQRVSTSEEAAEALARTTANSRLIERLRSLQPAARLVFQRAPEVTERPDMRLEDGDRLSVPPKPSTVGVSGSVFIVRVNGQVVSSRQQASGSWFSRGKQISGTRAKPCDTALVPKDSNKTTFLQATKDWTYVIFQFGVRVPEMKGAFQ
jgi:hypothetical protein